MIFENSKTATTGYANGLKGRISDLESDGLYWQNEYVDTLRPSFHMTDITFVISELLMKNVAFVKKNGLSEGAKDSREKLLYIMDKLEVFNTIAGENQKLKLMNRVLIGNVRSLKKELAEIRRQEGLNI